MLRVGDLVSGIGVLLFLIGAGFWQWFLWPKARIAKLRSRSPWHLLGNLTVIGVLVFVAGRILASRG
jgi:hypothetical protein